MYVIDLERRPTLPDKCNNINFVRDIWGCKHEPSPPKILGNCRLPLDAWLEVSQSDTNNIIQSTGNVLHSLSPDG